MIQRHPHIYFGPSDVHGRGVFTTANIEIGEIIEICPVLVILSKEIESIHQTALHDYYYLWGKDNQQAAIILGFGSLYNHSFEANAEFIPDYDMQTMSLFCIKSISAGEEIIINYLGDDDEMARKEIWF